MISALEVQSASAVIDKLANRSSWEPAKVNWLKTLMRKHRSDLNRLRNQVVSGAVDKVESSQFKVLSSFAGHAFAYIAELAKAYKNEIDFPLMTWSDFEGKVTSLPTNSSAQAEAKFFLREKAKNGHRLICNPGFEARVSHRLICNVVDAVSPPSPGEFNVSGLGSQAAVQRVIDHIETGQFTHFVVFDIANFFPSVQPKHLGWLKWPANIMKVAFLTDAYSAYCKSVGKTKTARHCLPQGAPASTRITSALLGRELRSFSEENGKVIYVDDGIIGARSHADAQEVAKALEQRLANLDGGPIGFGKLEIVQASQGFEFLGYWIRQDESDGQHKTIVCPNNAAKEKAKRKLHKKLRQREPGLEFDAAIQIAETYMRSWQKSFKHWHPKPQALVDLESQAWSWVDDYFQGYTKKIPPAFS